MNRSIQGRLAWVTAVVALLSLAGCASIPGTGGWPDTRGRANVVQGEVRSVDTRAQRLQLRQERGGNVTVRYDDRTRVVYRQRSYPVTALERGDRVSARLVYDRNGRAWAERIDVRENVRDRGRGGTARVQRVDGRVAWVDARRGAFGISEGRGTASVHLPRGASRADLNRFDRLRPGDRVRADVQPIGRNQFELVRFR